MAGCGGAAMTVEEVRALAAKHGAEAVFLVAAEAEPLDREALLGRLDPLGEGLEPEDGEAAAQQLDRERLGGLRVPDARAVGRRDHAPLAVDLLQGVAGRPPRHRGVTAADRIYSPMPFFWVGG